MEWAENHSGKWKSLLEVKIERVPCFGGTSNQVKLDLKEI